jgi:hypothetical protein
MKSLALKFFTSMSIMLVSTITSHAEDRIELGELECFVDEGTGFIIGSQKDISCVFTSFASADIVDNYFGVINKFGLDIGTTEESYIKWIVVAPTDSQFTKGFLQGDYIGAQASATFAVGLGANVLVGGSSKTFALQPVSLQTQTGLNIAAGVAEIELRSIVD